jgi:hypothetical protein
MRIQFLIQRILQWDQYSGHVKYMLRFQNKRLLALYPFKYYLSNCDRRSLPMKNVQPEGGLCCVLSNGVFLWDRSPLHSEVNENPHVTKHALSSVQSPSQINQDYNSEHRTGDHLFADKWASNLSPLLNWFDLSHCSDNSTPTLTSAPSRGTRDRRGLSLRSRLALHALPCYSVALLSRPALLTWKQSDSSVNREASSGLDGQGSLPERVLLARRVHPAFYPLWIGNHFLRLKRQGNEADDSPPTSAVVKKTWIYKPTSLYVFME